MLEQYTNYILYGVALASARFIIQIYDLENPANIPYMRLAFISSGILYYGLSAVLQQSINEENDLRPFEYENPDPNQPPIVTTYRDYDVGEANKQRIHTVLLILVAGVLHWIFRFNQPLVVQTIMINLALVSSPCFRVHVFNTPQTGVLVRPWKSKNILGFLDVFTSRILTTGPVRRIDPSIEMETEDKGDGSQNVSELKKDK